MWEVVGGVCVCVCVVAEAGSGGVWEVVDEGISSKLGTM